MQNNISKTILITGATSGIGESTAYSFAKAGWNVLITFHSNEDLARQVVEKCKNLGSQISKYYHLEQECFSSINQLLISIKKDFNNIDVLINNVGYMSDYNKSGLLKDLSIDEIDRMINVNLLGLIKLSKILIPIVNEQIVNIGSILAKDSKSEYSVYSASKWGVLGFSKSLALEVPELRIYCVNPGATQTKLNDFWEGGVNPSVVADIIYDSVIGKIEVASGGDIDVWKLI